MFLDEGSKGLLVERNVIYNVEHASLRFNRAEDIHVRQNVLVLADADTPVFRLNATPEDQVVLADNQVMPPEAFDPRAVELRDRVGARFHPADVPDPAGACERK